MIYSAADGWAVTIGTARRGLSGAAAHPGPSLYQMQQPTHQWPVYQLRIIPYGTVIAFGVSRVNLLLNLFLLYQVKSYLDET